MKNLRTRDDSTEESFRRSNKELLFENDVSHLDFSGGWAGGRSLSLGISVIKIKQTNCVCTNSPF